MKVLLSGVQGLSKGGVQSVIMTIVKALHKEITFDIVLYCNDKRYYDDEFLSYGGKIFRICPNVCSNQVTYCLNKFTFRKRLYKGFCQICKDGKYDVFHCHSETNKGIMLKAASNMGVPKRIAHCHTVHGKCDVSSLTYWLRNYERKLTKKYSTSLVAVSNLSGSIAYGSDDGFVTLFNPYDEKIFNPLLYKPRHCGNPIVLTQIGSYSENKNQLFSLQVFAELLKQIPDSRLNFIGFDYGDYFQRLKNKVSELGLEDKVVFYPGDVADRPKLLSESNYFLFPSFREGFGIALIEAQAMGVRCFASDSVPYETNVGGCTYLSLNSPREWANRMLEDYRRNITVRSYDCSNFNTENFIENIRNMYS